MSRITSNILVCGGTNNRESVKEIEIYDITDDQWITLSINLTISLLKCECFTLNGKNILIMGNKFFNKFQ